MSALNAIPLPNVDSLTESYVKVRRAAHGKDVSVLTDIYQDETNMAIWQRDLTASLKRAVDDFLTSNPSFQSSMTVTPEEARSSLSELFTDAAHTDIKENIIELVDMFCCLFDLKRVGLRLTVLDRAMCPKFHVDTVPCRLITTFQGAATEWLPHNAVDREKLGAGSKGKADNESGLYAHERYIQQLSCGDVALLKGELWEGNENAGLVHRSPDLSAGERRLLLTLDFSR